jgi:hypothetical protein
VFVRPGDAVAHFGTRRPLGRPSPESVKASGALADQS